MKVPYNSFWWLCMLGSLTAAEHVSSTPSSSFLIVGALKVFLCLQLKKIVPSRLLFLSWWCILATNMLFCGFVQERVSETTQTSMISLVHSGMRSVKRLFASLRKFAASLPTTAVSVFCWAVITLLRTWPVLGMPKHLIKLRAATIWGFVSCLSGVLSVFEKTSVPFPAPFLCCRKQYTNCWHLSFTLFRVFSPVLFHSSSQVERVQCAMLVICCLLCGLCRSVLFLQMCLMCTVARR